MNQYGIVLALLAGSSLLAACSVDTDDGAEAAEHAAVLARLDALEAESAIRHKLQKIGRAHV